jgi:hypothetical protein
MAMNGHVETLPDPAALTRRVADWMTSAALAAKGDLRVSLSGGSTPKALFTLLASDPFIGPFSLEAGLVVLGRRALRSLRPSGEQLPDDQRDDAGQGACPTREHSSRAGRRHP